MITKIFDRYLNRKCSRAEQLATALNAKVGDLKAVRLISHQMRLLGILKRTSAEDWLVLDDYDRTK